MQHVFGISRHVKELLDGAMDPPPEVFGSTTVEEHAACSFPSGARRDRTCHYRLKDSVQD